ncbi:hypothetical protein ACP4OV_010749 [Aristida adscensionis]
MVPLVTVAAEGVITWLGRTSRTSPHQTEPPPPLIPISRAPTPRARRRPPLPLDPDPEPQPPEEEKGEGRRQRWPPHLEHGEEATLRVGRATELQGYATRPSRRGGRGPRRPDLVAHRRPPRRGEPRRLDLVARRRPSRHEEPHCVPQRGGSHCPTASRTGLLSEVFSVLAVRHGGAGLDAPTSPRLRRLPPRRGRGRRWRPGRPHRGPPAPRGR